MSTIISLYTNVTFFPRAGYSKDNDSGTESSLEGMPLPSCGSEWGEREKLQKAS